MKMDGTILVIGGTGKVGREVVEQLVNRKAPIRVLVRSAHPELADLSVEAMMGDLADLATVEGALRGVEACFLLTPPPSSNEGALKRDRRRREEIGGPRRGASFGRWRFARFSYLLGPAARQGGRPPEGVGPRLHDSSAVLLHAELPQPSAIASQGAVYGNFESGQLAMVDTGTSRRLPGAGTPEWLARDVAMLGENIAAGQFAGTTDVVEKVAKRRPITFEQFVKDNIAAFR